MPSTRSKIAAGATIASLAMLGGVAYAAGTGTDDATTTPAPRSAAPAATATPQARTEAVHRSTHRQGVERHREDRGHEAEPGDDRGGHRELEPGDDHGRGFEPGDDSGGHGGDSGH